MSHLCGTASAVCVCARDYLRIFSCQPLGPVVKFARFPLVTQGFANSDPGRGHGTTHQATLRQHPTCHNYKNPQRRIYNYVPGGFGEKKENKIFKNKKKRKKFFFELLDAHATLWLPPVKGSKDLQLIPQLSPFHVWFPDVLPTTTQDYLPSSFVHASIHFPFHSTEISLIVQLPKLENILECIYVSDL